MCSVKPKFKCSQQKGCLIIIWTGLNVKIDIIQKVYEWSSLPKRSPYWTIILAKYQLFELCLFWYLAQSKWLWDTLYCRIVTRFHGGLLKSLGLYHKKLVSIVFSLMSGSFHFCNFGFFCILVTLFSWFTLRCLAKWVLLRKVNKHRPNHDFGHLRWPKYEKSKLQK